MTYLNELLSNHTINTVIQKIKNNDVLINEILVTTKFIDGIYDNIPLGQRLFHIKNDINHVVACKYCNINPARYHSSHRYGTCSKICAVNSQKQKYITTCEQKYDVNHTSKMPSIMIDMVKTTRNHYGGLWSNQTPDVLEKRRATYIQKLGVDHNTKTEEYRKNLSINNPAKTQHSKDMFRQWAINKMMAGIEEFELLEYGDILKIRDKRDGSIFEINKNTLQTRKNRHHEISPLKNPLRKFYSLFENEIAEFIKDNYRGEVITNSKSIISPFELDIYMPELHLAIEANGDYWHANPKNHDTDDVIIFQKRKMTAQEIWDKDKNKILICKKHNIKLETIWESEWYINKRNIKNHLLSLL